MDTLAPFLMLTFAVAIMGACFRPDDWYRHLLKPTWNPPRWVFAPVWTVLYALIAVAGWLAWQSSSADANFLLTLWAVQLSLNLAWPWLFFGRHNPDAAMGVIVILLGVIVAFIGLGFYLGAKMAAMLFLPYAVWVGFAAMLNFSLRQMNRHYEPPRAAAHMGYLR